MVRRASAAAETHQFVSFNFSFKCYVTHQSKHQPSDTQIRNTKHETSFHLDSNVGLKRKRLRLQRTFLLLTLNHLELLRVTSHPFVFLNHMASQCVAACRLNTFRLHFTLICIKHRSQLWLVIVPGGCPCLSPTACDPVRLHRGIRCPSTWSELKLQIN